MLTITSIHTVHPLQECTNASWSITMHTKWSIVLHCVRHSVDAVLYIVICSYKAVWSGLWKGLIAFPHYQVWLLMDSTYHSHIASSHSAMFRSINGETFTKFTSKIIGC